MGEKRERRGGEGDGEENRSVLCRREERVQDMGVRGVKGLKILPLRLTPKP